jgi:hypothetical protein
VVAYDNEMLPVTHPKSIEKIIPRLASHYGVKTGWPADRVRRELEIRGRGPVYGDWRGVRPLAEFAQAPTIDEFASSFAADSASSAREQLAAWAAGKPLPRLISEDAPYGRAFSIGRAIDYCEALLTDIEHALVALGDLEIDRIPRYRRGGEHNWVYGAPQRNFLADAAKRLADAPSRPQ